MRTLERNCGPFSSKVTSAPGAACAQVIAAKKPAAPPPATTTRRELMRETVAEDRGKVSPLGNGRSRELQQMRTEGGESPGVPARSAHRASPGRSAIPFLICAGSLVGGWQAVQIGR